MLNTTDPAPNKKGNYSHWLCTWNNPPDNYQEVLKASRATFIRSQLEVGENGTRHAQFYLYFKNSTKFQVLKPRLEHCAIFGKSKEAAADCYEYCCKPQTRVADSEYEWGDKPMLRKFNKKPRLCYEEVLANCKDGRWDKSDPEAQVKYLPNLLKLTAFYSQPYKPTGVRGLWIHGASGTGKSFVARSQFGTSLYIKPQSKWWDNYAGEDVVILDDFDHSGAGLSHLLKLWLDQYECRAEIKGATVTLRYSKFIITSQYLPEDIWPGDTDLPLRDAIRRRCQFCHPTGQFPNFVLKYDGDHHSESSQFTTALAAFIGRNPL